MWGPSPPPAESREQREGCARSHGPQTTGVKEGFTKLLYTTPQGINLFTWPEKVDPMVTLNEDIHIKPITVEPPGMDKKVFEQAKCLMVVFYFSSNFFPDRKSVV